MTLADILIPKPRLHGNVLSCALPHEICREHDVRMSLEHLCVALDMLHVTPVLSLLPPGGMGSAQKLSGPNRLRGEIRQLA